MRKAAVLLAVLVVVLLPQIGQAADLQAGWYANVGTMSTAGWRDGVFTSLGWTFGDQGNVPSYFEVTSPDDWWPQRAVVVSDSITHAVAGATVYLWAVPEIQVDFVLTDVNIHWETYYDASQMQLQLLAYDGVGYTLLWSEQGVGAHSGYRNVLDLHQSVPVGSTPVFCVTVVPEPSCLFTLSCPVAVLLARRRRTCCD
jgi:hypothetical protein